LTTIARVRGAVFVTAGVLWPLLWPSLAQAHTAGLAFNGWQDGFNHPLHGWDHLVVMLAIGLWASFQHGRARWGIPLTFVTAMAFGGVAGSWGLVLPVAEPMILISVAVFAALLMLRARPRAAVSFTIAAVFAVFHGFVHGREMPETAGLATFGLGFLIATILLHATGYVAARLAVTGAALMASPAAFAQSAADAGAIRIPEITVYGRQDSMIGMARSANQGTVGADQLAERPVMRTGEILETVPGIIITQHAGGGKANQYFLRGFNLDHGTDFATTLDDMPVNLPSHGHGQGYSDLNFLIPELVSRVNYQKGVYYAENGDFSSAGAAHLDSFRTLDKNFTAVEGGMFGYGRAVAGASTALGPGDILAGIEFAHTDGPWQKPDDYRKVNGVLTYSQGGVTGGFSITARGYHGRWNSSDQVAGSAISAGLIPFFGSLDGTTGGNSQRYSLQGEWHRADSESMTKVSAYSFYYDLNLFSNFTYFLTDPVHGDQFQQRDKRIASGLTARHTMFDQWGGLEVENTFGLQLRNDGIHNGLYQTEARQRVIKVNGDDGSLIPDITRQDKIVERSAGAYAENTLHWSSSFRSVLGLRADVFTFDVSNAIPQNSGSRTATVASPKLSLIYAPGAKTEIYLQGGLGYHSNDARGVLTHVDPVTRSPVNADGNAIAPADPLVRSMGADLGLRTEFVPGLQSTMSLWWLNLDSELVFSGDGGTTEPSRPSRRYGVEFANYYTPAPWITLDLDVSLSKGEFRDRDAAGSRIPESIQSVIAAGVTARDAGGAFGSLRLRYFGPRPLIEDNSIRSGATVLLNGQVGYVFNSRWTVTADVFNILDRRDHDIDYAYESRVMPSAQALTQVHFHPVEPRQLRVSVKAVF
jgi:hydrogenase/urease accessory protein HupE